MHRLGKGIAPLAALFACVPASATWYTNEGEFLAAVVDSYNEPLDMHTPGNPLNGTFSWDAPGANGFGWTLLQDMTSIAGGIRQDPTNEELAVFMTGRATYAFGGYFYGLDGQGNLHTNTHIRFHGGPGSMFSFEYNNGQPGLFVGWAGNVPLDTFFVHVATNNPSIPAHAAVTGIVVGSIVPEPTGFLVAGAGLVALLLRRFSMQRN